MKPRAVVIRTFSVIAVLAAAPLWAGPTGGAIAQTVTVAGAMPGKLSVGATGQASYDIPIAVPPGIAGMQPGLSLHYSSGAGNGIAGMGWSISGLSAITRCERTPAQDGQWGAVNYGADDRFCLGGRRLVAVSGVYGADGTEYRTEIDGFFKVVSYGKVTGSTGLQGASPEWFRVWTKSGRIMDFGATDDSRIEAVFTPAPAPETPAEVRAWAVSHVADTVGNYMVFSYFEDPLAGAHRIDRVDYTYNDAAAVTARSSIRFLYEARPDPRRYIVQDAVISSAVRLSTVQTFTDSALVHDYRLAYETGAATGRSRLASVTQCDSAANCLRPILFDWKPENAGFTNSPDFKLPLDVGQFDEGAFVDVNGDGLQDFVAGYTIARNLTGPLRYRTPYRTTWLNTGAGWEVNAEYQPLFDIKVADHISENGRQEGEFVDVNGDGLKDFVRAVRVNNTSYRTTWLNTGSGWVESAAYQPPFDIYRSWKTKFQYCSSRDDPCMELNTNYYNVREGEFVDLNGDGLADFVRAVKVHEFTSGNYNGGSLPPSVTNTYLTAWLNTGNGWVESAAHQPPTFLRDYWTKKDETCDRDGQCTVQFISLSLITATLADVDGDYLPDVVEAYRIDGGFSPVESRRTWLNGAGGWTQSSAHQPPVALWVHYPKGYTSSQDGRLADINGDGLPDFLQASNIGGVNYQTAWINTGNGWMEYDAYKPVFVFQNIPRNVYLFNKGSRRWKRVRRSADLVDVNGDGLPDVVEARNSRGVIYQNTWLNTGDGWRLSPEFKPSYLMYVGVKLTGIPVDLNGDGVEDVVRCGSGCGSGPWGTNAGRDTWLAKSVAPDQLLGVTDSLGATTTLSYLPLTDDTVYAKHDDAVFPVQDVQPPRHVVSEISRDDGVGGQYRTAYTYAGAKIDLTGRGIAGAPAIGPGAADPDSGEPGFREAIGPSLPDRAGPGYLGFRYVAITDLQTGIVTTRRSVQDFPFIGLTDFSDTTIPDPGGLTNGTGIARTTRTFAQRPLNLGANLFRYVAQSVTETFEPAQGHGNLAITTTTTTGTYDDFGNPTQVTATTAGGGQSFTTVTDNIYTNDTVNWYLGRQTRAAVTSTLPDLRSATRVSAFAWDPLTGLLAREIIEPDLPALTLTTDYARDAFGHVEATTVSGPDIATRTATAAYAAAAPNYGRFATTATNALGHSETRTFDTRFGALASLTGPNGLTTNWDHDGFGRRTLEARADGTETRWSYDLCAAQCPVGGVYAASAQGFVTATGLPYDALNFDYYDLLDRTFGTEAEGFNGTPVYTDKVFNALGQVEQVSRPFFAGTAALDIQWTATTYDNVGRPKTVTAPDGGVTSTAYGGLTTTVTNPLNQTQTRTETALGQAASTVDNAGTVTSFTYDPFGNLDRTNAGGVVTTMTYDIRGRKRTMDDPDMGPWSYGYNALGELTGQTDAKLQTVTMGYDKLGRMTTRTEPEGITTWAWDNAAKTAAIGKLDRVSRTEDDYFEDLFYDALGRPSETIVTYDARDYSYTTTYNASSRVATMTYPAAGDASRFAVENGYNTLGYLELVREFGGTGTIYWQAMTVDAEGRVTEDSLGNGLTGRRVFDPAGGLVTDIRVYAGLTAIKDHGFRFDLLGNLEFREDRLGSRREDFIHDALNRLTAATVIDNTTLATLGATTASYDALGNITAKSDVGLYAYDGIAAGPHAVTRAGNVDYSYDANGSMTASSFVDTAAAHRAFAWASFNKPTRMENSVTGAASEFVYGPSRARIKQTILDGAAVTKTTIYIGGGFERHAYASGPDELVHYIRAGGERVAIFTRTDDANPATDKTRWLHTDHLGSIDLVTDEAGLITETRSFDPWGRPREGDWTPAAIEPALAETPRGFTDHEHIQTVGLIHMNGRVQDPVLGRFISPDPSDALNPGVGFNRYSYALNNPLSLIDPDGFEISWEEVAMSPAEIAEQNRAMRDWMTGIRDYTVNDAYELAKMAWDAHPVGRYHNAIGLGLPDGPVFEPPAIPSREYAFGEKTAIAAELIGAGKALFDLGKWGLKALAKKVDEIPKYARNEYERLTPPQRREVLEQTPNCAYCGQPATTVDHIKSQKQDWVEGGYRDTKKTRSARVNDPENLTGACGSCNPSKGSQKLGDEWTPPKDRTEDGGTSPQGKTEDDI